MKRKVATYSTEQKQGAPALTLTAMDKGEVEALVSVFGNVDLQGDVVVPGAFKKSLAKWAASKDPIPVIWSHDWSDPLSHVGKVIAAEETAKGLLVRYKLDLDTARGAHVHRLLKERRVREHSFAYDVGMEMPADDGSNMLLELDLIECGPTLKGANPATELIGVKSLSQAIDDALADSASFPAPKNLEIARINREIDAAVAGIPNVSQAGVVTDVGRYVEEMRREIREERAHEAASQRARDRIHERAQLDATVPPQRVRVNARFVVIEESPAPPGTSNEAEAAYFVDPATGVMEKL